MAVFRLKSQEGTARPAFAQAGTGFDLGGFVVVAVTATEAEKRDGFQHHGARLVPRAVSPGRRSVGRHTRPGVSLAAKTRRSPRRGADGEWGSGVVGRCDSSCITMRMHDGRMTLLLLLLGL